MSNVRFGPIVRDAEIQGGTPVFAGTRVPVRRLFEYLESGKDLDDFLDGFPSISREQAVEVLTLLRDKLLADTA
jgi:uncharacterized protein (DUF433 family)